MKYSVLALLFVSSISYGQTYTVQDNFSLDPTNVSLEKNMNNEIFFERTIVPNGVANLYGVEIVDPLVYFLKITDKNFISYRLEEQSAEVIDFNDRVCATYGRVSIDPKNEIKFLGDDAVPFACGAKFDKQPKTQTSPTLFKSGSCDIDVRAESDTSPMFGEPFYMTMEVDVTNGGTNSMASEWSANASVSGAFGCFLNADGIVGKWGGEDVRFLGRMCVINKTTSGSVHLGSAHGQCGSASSHSTWYVTPF